VSGPVALPRPAQGDFDPAAAGYVALAPDIDDVVRQLTGQRDRVLGRFWAVTEVIAGHRYAAGKWSVREVIGHIADAERIFAYRLLRIARADETPLSGFDENTYVPAGEFDHRRLRELLNEWTATRNATIALVGGLPAEAWARHGTANGKNVTASALAYVILGHVEHHLGILRDRYGV
jgi:hypothetical protein